MALHKNSDNWTTGTVNGFDFQIKHFDNGSENGINEGRISKLWIAKGGKTYASYDRGWDIPLTDAEAKKAYDTIIKKYN